MDHSIPVAVNDVLISYREEPKEAQQSSKAILVDSSSGKSSKKSVCRETKELSDYAIMM